MNLRSISTFLLAAALIGPRAAAAQTEPPSWLLKYISFYSNVGSHVPNIQEPTVLRFYGWAPYDCPGIRDEAVIDQGHIQFKIRKISDICGDTTRTWSQDFDLGLLPLGDHQLTVTRMFVNAAGTDSTSESASFSFPVVDLGQPPPPPPQPPGPPSVPDWVVPYVAYGYTVPAQPNAHAPTTEVLAGLFPYDCGEIVDAASDSAHISFTMRPGAACSDTTRTWSHGFNLGLLAAGYHVVHVTRRLVWPESVSVAEGDFGVTVWADSASPPSPPPGPPSYPSVLIRYLSGWSTTGPVNSSSPTTLVLWGWFPYFCGQATATQDAPDRVHIMLRPGPACTDTNTVWRFVFDLGVLPAGPYPVTLTIDAEGDPSPAAMPREGVIPLYVDDVPVTNGIPNPFVSDTRFTVSNGQAGPVDVGIFDVNGRRIATLFRGTLAAGNREFRWNGRRDDGARAAIGVYFSRVAFSNRVVTRRLVMLPKQ